MSGDNLMSHAALKLRISMHAAGLHACFSSSISALQSSLLRQCCCTHELREPLHASNKLGMEASYYQSGPGYAAGTRSESSLDPHTPTGGAAATAYHRRQHKAASQQHRLDRHQGAVCRHLLSTADQPQPGETQHVLHELQCNLEQDKQSDLIQRRLKGLELDHCSN